MPEVYIGVKRVTAIPMTRKQYNDYRGWDLPKDENGADEGFLVKNQSINVKPNHLNHNGYISWVPKELFNDEFQRLKTPPAKSYPYGYKLHEYRVMREATALQEKLVKLIHFTAGHMFSQLDASIQSILRKQIDFMQGYLATLNESIATFEPDRTEVTDVESLNLDNVQQLISELDSDYRQKVSDGYHTFEELYNHRMILFAVICSQNAEHFWKSKLHADGTMYPDYFIVGCTTREGNFSYHYHIKHWDIFLCKELPNAPEYDGHTANDVHRLFLLRKDRKSNLSFGQAIEALKQGKRVARLGWNGKGMFVFRQVPSQVDASIVEKMTSLPDSVKAEFVRRRNDSYEVISTDELGKKDYPPHRVLNYHHQYALVKSDNSINGWHPSVADCESTDWIILD